MASSRASIADDASGHAVCVGDLASHALGLLARRSRPTVGNADRGWVRRLRDAVLAADPEARDRTIRDMARAGIAGDALCDTYVPAAARLLGEEWLADEISFAAVSIGTSRLQSLLRAVCSETPEATGGQRVMVIVGPETHHTLGAMLLTLQLRRQGASVRLLAGRPGAEAAETAEGGDYGAILLSASLCDDPMGIGATVARLREATRGVVPIIVGGGILHLGASCVEHRTGADRCTCDPQEALELSRHGARRPGPI